MEKFITHAAIPWRGCTRLSACLCTGLPNYGQELQRQDYLFSIVLAPVLRFQTAPNPHNRYSGPTITSLSKDERKAATK
jgi:hypothetical protein